MADVVVNSDVAGLFKRYVDMGDGTHAEVVSSGEGGGGGVAAATTTSVASAAINTTIVAANAARNHVSIFNDDANALLIKYGATASATSYKVKIPGGGYWEQPVGDGYTGIIDGIWEADGAGSARVTEQ